MAEAPITLHEGGAVVAVSEDHLSKIEGAFAVVEARGGDVEALALAAGVPLDVVVQAMADPATGARLLLAQDKAEDEGGLLKPIAARLTLAMLTQLREALAVGELDVDDIANLLPKVHKVVEHADRMDAARGNGYDGLTVFHVTFVNGHLKGRVAPDHGDVVDVEPAGGGK